MPLGILLAAGWAGMLTTAEIATEISQSLDFLETGLHDVPERQRSMRAVFAHTWSLQSPREQEVFRGLSVFRGGFTREAAQQVTGATLRDLMGLTDKSLIQRDPAGRYGIHELLRQYAEERLVERGEADLIHERRLAYLLSLAGTSGEIPGQLPPRDWLQCLFVERDNLRAALNWSLNAGDAESAMAGLRLAVRLRWFWYSSLPLKEGRDWLQRLLTANPGSNVLRARALEILGQILCDLGQYPVAQTLFEESLGISETLNDLPGVANATFKLSWTADETGDLARARQLLERSLALSQALNNPGQSAYILHSMARLSHLEGDLARARELYNQVIDQQRRLGMITLRSVLADLGYLLIRAGDIDRATELLRESLSLYRGSGGAVSVAVEAFGCLANAGNQPERSVRLLAAAETLRNGTEEKLDRHLLSDHERNMAFLRSQLDSNAFEAAWAEGAALTLEQAVELASSTA